MPSQSVPNTPGAKPVVLKLPVGEYREANGYPRDPLSPRASLPDRVMSGVSTRGERVSAHALHPGELPRQLSAPATAAEAQSGWEAALANQQQAAALRGTGVLPGELPHGVAPWGHAGASTLGPHSSLNRMRGPMHERPLNLHHGGQGAEPSQDFTEVRYMAPQQDVLPSFFSDMSECEAAAGGIKRIGPPKLGYSPDSDDELLDFGGSPQEVRLYNSWPGNAEDASAPLRGPAVANKTDLREVASMPTPRLTPVYERSNLIRQPSLPHRRSPVAWQDRGPTSGMPCGISDPAALLGTPLSSKASTTTQMGELVMGDGLATPSASLHPSWRGCALHRPMSADGWGPQSPPLPQLARLGAGAHPVGGPFGSFAGASVPGSDFPPDPAPMAVPRDRRASGVSAQDAQLPPDLQALEMVLPAGMVQALHGCQMDLGNPPAVAAGRQPSLPLPAPPRDGGAERFALAGGDVAALLSRYGRAPEPVANSNALPRSTTAEETLSLVKVRTARALPTPLLCRAAERGERVLGDPPVRVLNEDHNCMRACAFVCTRARVWSCRCASRGPSCFFIVHKRAHANQVH